MSVHRVKGARCYFPFFHLLLLSAAEPGALQLLRLFLKGLSHLAAGASIAQPLRYLVTGKDAVLPSPPRASLNRVDAQFNELIYEASRPYQVVSFTDFG